MIFKQIEIQNFMAIRSAKVELDSQGLVLIKGNNKDNPNLSSNGSGKSTIVESLVYALFGRTIRGIRGDEIINRVAKANCKVVLDIIDDDGSSYRIARYRKHKENKNSVFLFCNGTDITPKSEADFTKKVSDLIQTDFMTFTSSILYSAESFKFTQATDSELKSAFDIMLDLKVYSDCLEETKSELKELDSKYSKLELKSQELDNRKLVFESGRQKAMDYSKGFEDLKESKIESLEDKIEALEDKKSSVDDKIKEYEDKLVKLNETLEEMKLKKKKSSKTEEAIKALRESIDEDEDEKSELNKTIRKTKSLIESIKEDIESNIEESQTSKKLSEDCKRKIETIKSEVGAPCPTCGKPLDEEHFADAIAECKRGIELHTKSAKDYLDQNKGLEDELKVANKNLEGYKNDMTEIEEELSQYEELLQKAKKRQKKETELDREILAQESDINNITYTLNSHKTEKDSFDYKIKTLEEQIEEESEKTNPYLEQIKDYDLKISELNPEYDKISSESKEIDDEKDLLNFWLKGFSNSGIKSMLLDDITPFLNKRANKYLKALSGDHISVNFTTQTKLKSGEMREKFQIELTNEDGGNSYVSNSSGEKRRVDVAINLALQDLLASRANKKINFVVLDEVMDSLDSAGVDDVLKLLQEISKEKSSIFVISHNENIQTAFENFLIVTKKDGYSTVTKE